MNQIHRESTEALTSGPETIEPVTCLKLISGTDELVLEPTDGKANIASSAAVFESWLDPDFKAWGCDVQDSPKGPQALQVHEQVRDGMLVQVYDSLGIALDALCLSQDQIVQFFVRRMYDKYLIRENSDDAGYGYFRFLFKVRDEFFVAHVYVRSGGSLKARVRRLSYVYVWDAEYRYRFVIPQLAASAA